MHQFIFKGVCLTGRPFPATSCPNHRCGQLERSYKLKLTNSLVPLTMLSHNHQNHNYNLVDHISYSELTSRPQKFQKLTLRGQVMNRWKQSSSSRQEGHCPDGCMLQWCNLEFVLNLSRCRNQRKNLHFWGAKLCHMAWANGSSRQSLKERK
jgi:hypothetical protein